MNDLTGMVWASISRIIFYNTLGSLIVLIMLLTPSLELCVMDLFILSLMFIKFFFCFIRPFNTKRIYKSTTMVIVQYLDCILVGIMFVFPWYKCWVALFIYSLLNIRHPVLCETFSLLKSNLNLQTSNFFDLTTLFYGLTNPLTIPGK